MSKAFECRSETTSLRAGESFLAVNTGAPFNDVAPDTCNWSVKPADGNTLLRVVLNFANMTSGQVLVSAPGQPVVK